MSKDESKTTFGFETYHERDVQWLADAISNCRFRRISGECNENDCDKCAQLAQINNCYDQLPDIDKLKIDSLARTSARNNLCLALFTRALMGTNNQPKFNDKKSINKWLKRLGLRWLKFLIIGLSIFAAIYFAPYLFAWLGYGVMNLITWIANIF